MNPIRKWKNWYNEGKVLMIQRQAIQAFNIERVYDGDAHWDVVTFNGIRVTMKEDSAQACDRLAALREEYVRNLVAEINN